MIKIKIYHNKSIIFQFKLLNKIIKMLKENEKELEENINIELKTNISTLNIHTDSVYCLTLLHDGRLTSGSADKLIIIYHKETYKPDLIIKEHKKAVNCLIQLKNGILSSCSNDKTIKLFFIKENCYNILQTLNLHSNWVYKILELSNNYLVSGSSDKTIIFYIKENIKYKKDYSISVSDGVENIIEIKQNEIVYSTDDGKINFFDLNERKNKSIIENIRASTNSFCMIRKHLLLIPGFNIINIINVNEYKKIRQIDISNTWWIKGVCMLNFNIIITCDYNRNLIKWKIDEDNLILAYKKEEAHNNFINIVLNLCNGHFATGSSDNTIKIW